MAQKFNAGSQMAEDLFAGPPPLEAERMLLSEAATVEKGDAGTSFTKHGKKENMHGGARGG